MSDFREQSLDYHRKLPHGKVEIRATKPCRTQKDLSMAYTPGVAQPCLEIEKDPSMSFEYTNRANLVAVVTNGTAVLGLGNIGALAAKPVMEGKSVLFKRFAGVDAYDINLASEDVEILIQTVKLMEPTFGGINLEDIKAPECFEIENRLKQEMDIPVFHDDQHGTSIISGAGLLNAVGIAGKDISELKVVCNGAGASGIACSRMYVSLGVKKENVVMCDSKGPLTAERKDLNEYKKEFATDRKLSSLAEALEGADLFLGLSVKGVLSGEMVKSMNHDPIIFAMANPDPEITYEEATGARKDVIMATGRSDYPNQINNVLGFPFIFRGALDVSAKSITEEMKIAAARALAELARKEVIQEVRDAYDGAELSFGREYIIPKPFDPRVLWTVAPAVAEAAVKSGVARKEMDFKTYPQKLKKMAESLCK